MILLLTRLYHQMLLQVQKYQKGFPLGVVGKSSYSFHLVFRSHIFLGLLFVLSPLCKKPCYHDGNCFWGQSLKLFICCAFENTHLCISEKDSKACYLSSLCWKWRLRLRRMVPRVDARRCVWEGRQQRIFALTGRRRVSVSVNISISWEVSSRPPVSSLPVTMAKISISSSTCKPAATQERQRITHR